MDCVPDSIGKNDGSFKINRSNSSIIVKAKYFKTSLIFLSCVKVVLTAVMTYNSVLKAKSLFLNIKTTDGSRCVFFVFPCIVMKSTHRYFRFGRLLNASGSMYVRLLAFRISLKSKHIFIHSLSHLTRLCFHVYNR